ncbi:Hypothetical protein NTJ_12836 [Nesidiocoris tenuis]|uniref:Uncharacterized protein n=1 Tax=Nesidiocoris tenuis TaxID=355587 RepID=A0ABN7B8Q5_9HEMI|nr:Hypothetical protein NTJ_12836 [Nesidiocoris tenuis]
MSFTLVLPAPGRKPPTHSTPRELGRLLPAANLKVTDGGKAYAAECQPVNVVLISSPRKRDDSLDFPPIPGIVALSQYRSNIPVGTFCFESSVGARLATSGRGQFH